MSYRTGLLVIGYTWATLGIVWLGGLAFTKRTLRSQPLGPRLFQMAIAVLGFTLIGSERLGGGWLGRSIFAPVPRIETAGVLLTLAGCLFAIWARFTLGSNWSGRATVKAGHELIVQGPYALTRHPIYTGLLLASVGSALAVGEWRCVVGLVLILIVFAVKIGQEEKLMLETFPEAYPRYRERVKAIVPGLL